jgi:hypothetical protein
MKVIAKASEDKYLCEIKHEELEKFMDLYYGRMDRLAVGEEVDLAQGYNFAVRIEAACKGMVAANEEFGKAQKVMTSYAIAIANSADLP